MLPPSIAWGLNPRPVKIKDIQTLYMKSILIKAFLMMVLIFQLGLDGQSQPPSFGTDVDDVTATSGPVGGSSTSGSTTGGASGSGTGSGPTYTGSSTGRNDVPIDGGLSLLLAAGIGYGVKRARSKAKKNLV